MNLRLSEINYLAVLVAGLAAFFLGGLWYTAIFGKLWTKLHGYSDEQVKEMKAKMSPAKFFGGMILSYLVVAFVVAVMVTSFDIRGTVDGALLGLALWLGPAAAIGLTGHLASAKQNGIYLIDVSFQLIFLVMIGVIIGIWR